MKSSVSELGLKNVFTANGQRQFLPRDQIFRPPLKGFTVHYLRKRKKKKKKQEKIQEKNQEARQLV